MNKNFLKKCLCGTMVLGICGTSLIPTYSSAMSNSDYIITNDSVSEVIDSQEIEQIKDLSENYIPQDENIIFIESLSAQKIIELNQHIQLIQSSNPSISEGQLNNYAVNLIKESANNNISFYELPYIQENLNAAENVLFNANPVKGLNVCSMAYYATNKAAELFQSNTLYQGNGDAYRHAHWNADMAHTYGSSYAEKWANAHESESPSGYDKTMDLFNNRVGRDLGTSTGGGDRFTMIMQSKLLDLINNGSLRRIVNGVFTVTDSSGQN